ncbi:hypothetical protein [Streptomyces sp. NPDC050504]|uniref:hypothetical protein n=1 Tax=Streptomyces sp. NPDC050504 TaxID=3365618 RepID=UPI00378DD1F0
MNPRTYATLYGPWRPAPPPRRTGTVLLSFVVWSLALGLLGLFTACVGLLALLFVESGNATDRLLWGWALTVAAVGASAAATAYVPAVRRMTSPSTTLVLGVVTLLASVIAVGCCLAQL